MNRFKYCITELVSPVTLKNWYMEFKRTNNILPDTIVVPSLQQEWQEYVRSRIQKCCEGEE